MVRLTAAQYQEDLCLVNRDNAEYILMQIKQHSGQLL